MLPKSDSRIDALRKEMERLNVISGTLHTLKITIARADELLGIIARCSCSLDAARLRQEQAALGHPLRLRILLSQLEGELRKGLSIIGIQLRAAIDAATAHVTTAAGGLDAAQFFPFALRHLEELAMHRNMPPAASTTGRLVFICSAWMAIDAAMASLEEIRFDARSNKSLQ